MSACGRTDGKNDAGKAGRPLRVAINAECPGDGAVGGIELFVAGLVYGLGRLEDGPERYVVVGLAGESDWLRPYLGPQQVLVTGPESGKAVRLAETLKTALGPLPGPVGRFWWRTRSAIAGSRRNEGPALPGDRGLYHALDVDVVHFPHQGIQRCSVPTVYSPHDLLYSHFPHFFTPGKLAWCQATYPAGCRQAAAIAVESHWVKQDVVRQYGIDPGRVYVFRWASPTDLYEPVTSDAVDAVRARFALPEAFAFYPAKTWPHKNHLGLLEALRFLRDQEGLAVRVVCTGPQNAFWPTIAARVHELGMENQVQFLGFVTARELRALYRLAQFVVFPSLFEGGGLPVMEALREGAPMACSTATCLLEYGGDAVLPFDPESPAAIAGALRRMVSDAPLRARLREAGLVRSRLFDWERMARGYRALYRMLARRPLTDEDRALLRAASGSLPGPIAPAGRLPGTRSFTSPATEHARMRQ